MREFEEQTYLDNFPLTTVSSLQTVFSYFPTEIKKRAKLTSKSKFLRQWSIIVTRGVEAYLQGSEFFSNKFVGWSETVDKSLVGVSNSRTSTASFFNNICLMLLSPLDILCHTALL